MKNIIDDIKYIRLKGNSDIYIDKIFNIINNKIGIILSEEEALSPITIININSILSELKSNVSDNLELNNDNPEYENYVII